MYCLKRWDDLALKSQISLQSNRLTTRSSGESAVRLEIAIISIYGAKWPERSSWHVQGMASECARFQSGLHDEIKSEPRCQDIVWNLYAESGVSLILLVRSLCCAALVFRIDAWMAGIGMTVTVRFQYLILHSFVCIPRSSTLFPFSSATCTADVFQM